MTSGIPDPAAAGAMKAQRAAAATAKTTLQPAYAAKALKYLHWNHYGVIVVIEKWHEDLTCIQDQACCQQTDVIRYKVKMIVILIKQ